MRGVGGFLAIVLLAAGPARGQAMTFYKCRDAAGHAAYQSHPCAGTPQRVWREPVAPPIRANPATTRPALADAVAFPPPRAGIRLGSRRPRIDPVTRRCRSLRARYERTQQDARHNRDIPLLRRLEAGLRACELNQAQ